MVEYVQGPMGPRGGDFNRCGDIHMELEESMTKEE